MNLISFTAGAKVSVALSYLKSNTAEELFDIIRRFIVCNSLQTLAKADIPKLMACSSFLLYVQCVWKHRHALWANLFNRESSSRVVSHSWGKVSVITIVCDIGS